jgi:uncharacterized HAD superfamily protein
MRIGIDIDDVITNTSELIEECVESIDQDSNREKILKHMKEIMKGTPTDPEVIKFCVDNYYKVFQNVRIKDNVSRVIQDLLDQGNEIYLITARGNDNDYFKDSEEATKKFLEDNEIKYTKIIFNAINKAKICLDNQIDVMVDDSVDHCEEVKNVGIRSILFTSSVNKNIITTVERVDNWLDLEKKITM